MTKIMYVNKSLPDGTPIQVAGLPIEIFNNVEKELTKEEVDMVEFATRKKLRDALGYSFLINGSKKAKKRKKDDKAEVVEDEVVEVEPDPATPADINTQLELDADKPDDKEKGGAS